MASYTELITGAISSFNSVWNALKVKGDLLTQGQKDGNTLVPTAQYGDLIKRLVLINGVDGTNLNTVDSVLSGNSAITLKTTNGIAVENGKFVLSAVLPKDAYYTTGATLKLTVDAQDIAFSPTLSGVVFNEDDGIYSYATSDSLIKSFTVDEGSVTTTIDSTNGLTNTLSNHVSSEVNARGNVAADKVVLTTTESTEDHYIDIDISALTTGSITATAVTEIGEGYVVPVEDDEDKISTLTKTYGEDSTIADTKTIRIGIKKGSVEISSSNSENTVASITSTDNTIWADANVAADKKIKISSSVSGLELNGNFTEGYVTAGSTIEVGEIEIPDGEKYIKKGSLESQTVTITDAQIDATSTTSNLISTESTGVSITVSQKDTISQAIDFETGFIGTSGATINTTLSKTINIKKAAGVSAVAKLTGIAAAGAVVSESATGRAIILTPTLDVSNKSLTSGGYIGAASEISFTEATDSLKTKTIYINEGSASISDPTFVATLSEDVDGNGSAGTQTEIGSIFVANAETLTGDYFTVTSSTTLTKTEGYIDAESVTKTVTRYMPKAVIEKVIDGTDEYLQVKTAGYLPSGTIAEVSAVSPSIASVNLALTGIEAVSESNKASGVSYQKITISKSGVTAGYISDSKGALTGNELYVKKGTVSATPSATYVQGTVARSVDTDGTVSYALPITASLVSGVTLTDGYFATNEIPTNLNTAVTSETAYNVGRATLNTSVHTTEVSTSGTVLADTSKSSSYVITPSITKCTASFSVNKAGYLSADDDDSLVFNFKDGHGISNGDASKFFIKAGGGVVANGVTNVSNNSITVSNINKDTGKITQISTGAYTLSVGGTVSANISLDEGYYGTAEKTLQSVAVSLDKDITIAHGSVTAGLSESNSNSLTSAGVTLYTEDETDAAGSDRNFVSLSATATVNTNTTVVEGYVKSNDKTEASQATYSATKYIELYKNTSTDTYEGESVYKVSVGQTTATLPATAPETNTFTIIENGEKYSEKDTKVVLSDNAMGKSVITELLALERRLNGYDLPTA